MKGFLSTYTINLRYLSLHTVMVLNIFLVYTPIYPFYFSRLDYDSWQCLLTSTSPWSSSSVWPVLCHRIWTILDQDRTGCVNFRHVVSVISILSSSVCVLKVCQPIRSLHLTDQLQVEGLTILKTR